MLIRWRIGNGSFVTSLPATKAIPDVGRRSVARIWMSVVFLDPGDPVAHQDALHVGKLRDLRLVVVEVIRELVRIELCEFDRDALDVRRPDITQRFTPLSTRKRSKGRVLNKGSEENRDTNSFHA